MARLRLCLPSSPASGALLLRPKPPERIPPHLRDCRAECWPTPHAPQPEAPAPVSEVGNFWTHGAILPHDSCHKPFVIPKRAEGGEEPAVRIWVAQRFSAAIKPTKNNWRLQPPSQAERSDAQHVWNGHSRPFPLTMILKLVLMLKLTLTKNACPISSVLCEKACPEPVEGWGFRLSIVLSS